MLRSFASIFVCCAVLCTGQAVFAQDMALSQVLIDGEGWEEVTRGFKFTEGPAVDGAGNVYFTDIPNNRIHKIDAASGKVSVFLENSGGANGLMFGPDGRLYGCQNGKKRIAAWDAKGQESTIADEVESNDLVITKDGGVYFTDFGNKRVWYVSPKGEKRVVDEGISRPNGVILWPDQGTLVVTDFAGPFLWVFRIEADGSLSSKQAYYTPRLPQGKKESGADGMTVDSAGRLYAATLRGLQVFDPTGRLSGVILKPQPAFLSNVVFGGPKLDTLYVTCADKVYRRKTKATGLRYFADKPTGK
jgi:gluconolactonase